MNEYELNLNLFVRILKQRQRDKTKAKILKIHQYKRKKLQSVVRNKNVARILAFVS